MKHLPMALIGFGNVGQGLARIIVEHGERIAAEHGVQLSITAVCDLYKGSVYDPKGLNPKQLLEAIERSGNLNEVPAPHRGWDAPQTIRNSNAQVIAELSYTDLKTGQPALDHMETALRAGKWVVTTNKGPIALRFPQLRKLAEEHGGRLGIEGTVMSGTPALNLGMHYLKPASISAVEGILNGTTNFMLTRMDQGADYATALAEAQRRGFAEADPTGDVEGFDAAGKAVILANLLMDAELSMADVARKGITELTPEDLAQARAAGERWKLLAWVRRTEKGIEAGVAPCRIGADHPLFAVDGATNAISYTTDLLGTVTLTGPGAGRLETGYALIEDMLAMAR